MPRAKKKEGVDPVVDRLLRKRLREIEAEYSRICSALGIDRSEAALPLFPPDAEKPDKAAKRRIDFRGYPKRTTEDWLRRTLRSEGATGLYDLARMARSEERGHPLYRGVAVKKLAHRFREALRRMVREGEVVQAGSAGRLRFRLAETPGASVRPLEARA